MTRRGPHSALRDFLHSEAAGGIVLIVASLLAMVVANLQSTGDSYAAMLHMRAGPVLNDHLGPMTIHLWINDGLMAIFFFLVGLEIKREVVDGGLTKPERRRLPVVAALAGMAVPALVYLSITSGMPGLQRGWAIPAATDIAFAIGVLALLGDRVPTSLKLFLTTVAIVDDMGAVAIIALAYTDHIAVAALAGAAVVAAGLYALNRRGERRPGIYLAGFALLWLLTLMSGVHATIAGVVAALAVPVKPTPAAPDAADSTLHRLEHALHPLVAFAIVPLFGFANAGVSLDGIGWAALGEPLVLGIALGLFIGKQAGIFGGVWLADRLGIAERPKGVSWLQLYGVALVAGIGFTMSLFIGGLAFPGNPMLEAGVKIGVLGGSILSAIAGFTVLRLAARR
ncbi:sodium:proton antiporter [Sphingomonas sp. Leaf33]|uniref:Na+/H+ antiporter NhaA n=1 Tax=Sphingomonas sp. Leaf33 TaxID=1736215 RepID=UPI0006F6731A|nr:Na+/H+ antiporter NhaA [Sphingomonas sp. Leaf33]KQN25465.1 sodium:proton antiporter [Sphingomonas sp. Leaf33]